MTFFSLSLSWPQFIVDFAQWVRNLFFLDFNLFAAPECAGIKQVRLALLLVLAVLVQVVLPLLLPLLLLTHRLFLQGAESVLFRTTLRHI